MAEITSLIQVKERRSENRKSIDRFYCVEIDLGRPLPIYQFKLRNISGHGACVLVKEDSSILKSLKIPGPDTHPEAPLHLVYESISDIMEIIDFNMS